MGTIHSSMLNDHLTKNLCVHPPESADWVFL